MNTYIISFSLGSSYPEFAVIVAESALDARRIVEEEKIMWSNDQYVTGIDKIDTTKRGLVKVASFCC